MGFLEDAWDNTVGKNSWIGSGQASKDIEKSAQQLGQNIETNYQNLGSNLAALGSGNFNNFAQTMLTMGLSMTGITDPSMVKSIAGESAVVRAKREAQETLAAQEIEANLAKERERLSGLADLLTASASARRLAPGMSQTLLGSAPSTALITTKA